MTLEVHELGLGDTLTPIAAQFKQKSASGTWEGVNLSGLTVKFSMVDDQGNTIVDANSSHVTVTDSATGKVSYDFQAADVANPGRFFGWFHVFSSTEHDTYPIGSRQLEINIYDPRV